MKKLILCFLALSFIFCNINAQNKKVELYNLIVSLLPDNSEGGNFISWTKPFGSAAGVKWDAMKPTLNKVTQSYYKNGTADVSLNGSTIICGGSKTGCDWGVSLEGNLKGYNKISISPDLSFTQWTFPNCRIFIWEKRL